MSSSLERWLSFPFRAMALGSVRRFRALEWVLGTVIRETLATTIVKRLKEMINIDGYDCGKTLLEFE